MVRGLTVGFLGVGSGGAGRTWRRHEPNWTASAEMGFRPCVVSQLSVLIRVCLSGSKNAWCTREDYKHLSRPAGDCPSSSFMEQSVLSCDIDLLHPTAEFEKRSHKLKRLVESPNSYFMDVKCQGCFSITTVFSHSQTVVVCPSCNAVLCVPTGGKAKLSEGCSFRRKGD